MELDAHSSGTLHGIAERWAITSTGHLAVYVTQEILSYMIHGRSQGRWTRSFLFSATISGVLLDVSAATVKTKDGFHLDTFSATHLP